MTDPSLIPQADPGLQYRRYRQEIDVAVARVLESGRYILGPEVEAFEQEFAAYCGVKHAVGVASGTDALRLALWALNLDSGAEVIAPAHTAVATIVAIERVGARPVLVDIDPATYTMAPESVARAITPRTQRPPRLAPGIARSSDTVLMADPPWPARAARPEGGLTEIKNMS